MPLWNDRSFPHDARNEISRVYIAGKTAVSEAIHLLGLDKLGAPTIGFAIERFGHMRMADLRAFNYAYQRNLQVSRSPLSAAIEGLRAFVDPYSLETFRDVFREATRDPAALINEEQGCRLFKQSAIFDYCCNRPAINSLAHTLIVGESERIGTARFRTAQALAKDNFAASEAFPSPHRNDVRYHGSLAGYMETTATITPEPPRTPGLRTWFASLIAPKS